MTDLQRALAEIDRMIEDIKNMPPLFRRGHPGVVHVERARLFALIQDARSRLSALATTTHGEQG